MRLHLVCHPETPSEAADAIEVEVVRSGRNLVLRYSVHGEVGRIALAEPAPPERTDELWRHTCFEAFVQAPDEAGYLEFNLSPSSEWAAYRFSGYRTGMAPADVPTPRVFDVDAGSEVFRMAAHLILPNDQAFRLGLTAVIEETGGSKSYWALVHPGGRPDFHHADGFAYSLAEEVP